MKDKIIKKVVVTPKKVTIHYKECQNSPIVNVIERDDPMTPGQQSHFSACVNSMIQDALTILAEDKRQEEIDYNDESETPEEELDEIIDESEPEGEEPEGTTEPEPVDNQTVPEPPKESEPDPKVVDAPKKKRGRPKKKKDQPDEPKVGTPEVRGTGLRPTALRPTAPQEDPEPNVFRVPEEGVTGADDGMSDEPSPEESPRDWGDEPIPMFENSEIPEFKRMEKGHLIWYINNNDKETIIEDVKWNFNKSMKPDSSLQNIRVQALEIAFDELKISH